MERSDFKSILLKLCTESVDFIVVGGIAGILHGATITTFDVDIVHSREPNNVKRLLRAFSLMNAHYRERADRNLAPSAASLAGTGHHLLITDFGPLDVLGEVTGQRGYSELVPHSTELTLNEGLKFRVLDLPTLIRLKEELHREKDISALTILRQTLKERDNR